MVSILKQVADHNMFTCSHHAVLKPFFSFIYVKQYSNEKRKKERKKSWLAEKHYMSARFSIDCVFFFFLKKRNN